MKNDLFEINNIPHIDSFEINNILHPNMLRFKQADDINWKVNDERILLLSIIYHIIPKWKE
jgi:hypothetical protein